MHGRAHNYTRDGCRCAECRAAYALWARRWRAKRRNRDPRATVQCVGCGNWFYPPTELAHGGYGGGIYSHEPACEAFV